MLFLYKTASSAFHQQALDVLDQHGIETYTKKIPVLSFVSWRSVGFEYDINVCNDEDFDRAKQLLISIGADDPAPIQLPGKHTMPLVIALCLCTLAMALYFFDRG